MNYHGIMLKNRALATVHFPALENNKMLSQMSCSMEVGKLLFFDFCRLKIKQYKHYWFKRYAENPR